ncbi:hypothetical protein ABZP36_035991 [Zizania latifolia]
MTGDQRCMTTLGRIHGDEPELNTDDWPEAKRMRQMPSSISINRGSVAAEKIQKIGLDLEPIFRKVVQEELERSLSKHGHLLYRAPSLLANEVGSLPSLKLSFARPLSLPIFTNNKLVDVDSNPLRVQLLDITTGYYMDMDMNMTTSHHLGLACSHIKLEVLVLDGDFKHGDSSEGWTSDEFSAAIVKERQGRRPLLVGTLNMTMADHGVAVIDDVSFTDNSSWIRSRKFRIGVRAVPGVGPKIQEAVSESFMVKDHRGESYKKHFPPEPTDELWRLKNIRKDGPIHKRLESERVRNVQDFLNLHATHPEKLKKLVAMSNRLWKATLNHGKTCDVAKVEMMQVKQSSIEIYQNLDQLQEAETSKAVSNAGNGLMASSNLGQAHDGSLITPDSDRRSLLQDEMSTSSGPDCRSRQQLGSEDYLPAAASFPGDLSCEMLTDHGDLIIWNNSSPVWEQLD